MAGSDAPRTYTPEQRDFVQEIYAGADQAGAKIAGIATVQRVEDAEVGKIDNPIKIGQTGTVTVRVGKNGDLLPPRGYSDEAATSVLHIDVHADVVWDSNGDSHIRYIAYAKQIDTRTARFIEISRSGPSTAEWQEQMAGRPDHEAYNDPDFKDWVVETMPPSPMEAVRQAFAPLVGGPNQLLTGQIDPPTPPPPVVSAKVNTEATEPERFSPLWLTAIGGLVVVALITALGFWMLGGSDDDASAIADVEIAAGEIDQREPVVENATESANASGDAADTEDQDPPEEEPDPPVVVPPADEPVEDATEDKSVVAVVAPADEEPAQESLPEDECSEGTAVDGTTAGLDALLTVTGYRLLVDLATSELWMLLCFSQPWALSTPTGLWSFAHVTVVEVLSGAGLGFAAAPPEAAAFTLYEFHDGVWTFTNETNAGAVEPTFMITKGGNSLMRTGLTVQPNFEARLFIQTASTPSPSDEVSRFEFNDTFSNEDATLGEINELVEVADVDVDAFPGIDPDGFGPERAPPTS